MKHKNFLISQKKKIDIIIHPNSLVHAVVELKNGLIDLIYHESTMIIPIANAIFEDKLIIDDFIKLKSPLIGKGLLFKKVDKKKFPLISLKKIATKHPSTPIIINASNELAVSYFLKNKIPFDGIARVVISVLNDRNFKKNAVIKPLKLTHIFKINNWAKKLTLSKIKKFYD